MPAADAGPGDPSSAGFDAGFDAGFEVLSSAPGEAGGWELAARVPPESRLFLGHFPGRPIVPGVALLALVARAAADWRGAAGALLGVRGLKLRRPVGPGEALALRLGPGTPASAPPDVGEEIAFELRRTEGDREAVATGRVRLGRPADRTGR
jgi:hypothetical protein